MLNPRSLTLTALTVLALSACGSDSGSDTTTNSDPAPSSSGANSTPSNLTTETLTPTTNNTSTSNTTDSLSCANEQETTPSDTSLEHSIASCIAPSLRAPPSCDYTDASLPSDYRSLSEPDFEQAYTQAQANLDCANKRVEHALLLGHVSGNNDELEQKQREQAEHQARLNRYEQARDARQAQPDFRVTARTYQTPVGSLEILPASDWYSEFPPETRIEAIRDHAITLLNCYNTAKRADYQLTLRIGYAGQRFQENDDYKGYRGRYGSIELGASNFGEQLLEVRTPFMPMVIAEETTEAEVYEVLAAMVRSVESTGFPFDGTLNMPPKKTCDQSVEDDFRQFSIVYNAYNY